MPQIVEDNRKIAGQNTGGRIMEETKESICFNYSEIKLLLEALGKEDERLSDIETAEDYRRIRRVWQLMGKLEAHKEIIENL